MKAISAIIQAAYDTATGTDTRNTSLAFILPLTCKKSELLHLGRSFLIRKIVTIEFDFRIIVKLSKNTCNKN